MLQRKPLKLHTTKGETIGGGVYLLIELFFLPSALVVLNASLSRPMDAGILNFFFFSLNFLVTLLIFHKFMWNHLKFSLKHIPEILKTAILGFLLYWAANFAISGLLILLIPGFSNVNDGSIAVLLREHPVLIGIGTILLVPPVEEMLHRGLVFQCLHQQKPVFAYIFSSVLFSVIHVMGYIGKYEPVILLGCFLQYLPAGLILARAYEKSDSLFTSILIHMAVNCVGIFLVR